MPSKIVLSYSDAESASFQEFWGHSKAPEDKLEELRSRAAASRCPWCRQPAQRDEEIVKVPFDHSQSDMALGVSDGTHQALWRCHCGWWMHQYQDGLTTEYHRVIQQGILRLFDITSPEMPIDALSRHIGDPRRFADLKSVHPTTLERWTKELLTDYLKCEVRHVGGPGDHGVDLLAIVSDGPPIAVQVKRRLTRPTEAVSVVRELVGAMVEGDYVKGMLVTTADKVSDAGAKLAEKVSRRGLVIDLLDFESIRSIFGLAWRDESQRGEQAWRNLSQAAERSLYRFGMSSAGYIDQEEVAPPPFGGDGGSRTISLSDWQQRVMPLFLQQQRVLNTNPSKEIPYIAKDGTIAWKRGTSPQT